MIRQIRGKVISADTGSLIVEVAGLGMLVYTAGSETIKPGSEIALATHLAVKQDGMDLYGFIDPADRDFFELALTVSGVGPKTALGLLRRSPREGLESAIGRRDIPYLTRVAGLSKKSAEKLVVELAEKLASKKDSGDGDDSEVFDTLVALGYTEREARKALGGIPETVSGKEGRLRAALSAGTK